MSTNAAAPAAQQSKSSLDAPSCEQVHQKMTKAMSASLENLRSSLLCGLCNQMMKDAATLGCAHSFCYNCISKYTENKWNCPFPACNISVTSMKGNSDSYIKRNPQINDVVIALQRIEENVGMAPDRWWETGDNTAAAANVNNDDNNVNKGKGVQEEDDDEEEIVDFAAMQHNDNDSSNDESSTTKAYEPQGENNERSNMNEMSIEQSLFPSDQSVEADSSLPRFSGVSTIAWKNSQMTEEELKKSPESSTSPDGPQTATASQLDRVLMFDSDQQNATKAAASSGVEIKRSVKENESKQSEKRKATKHLGKKVAPEQSEKKQTPKKSEKKRKQSMAKEGIDERKPAPKSRRTQRVSFQELPKVMLLKQSLSLKNTESRSLRKCIKDDMISMLKMQRDDVIEDDNLDTGFDFDTEDGRGQFLSLLSSSKNGHSTAVSSSCFALSTEREYAFDEGVVVPRSFQFYLAVACGLPIVDMSFLESQSKKKRLGIMNHQRYPFPSIDEKKLSKEEKATHVIGASNHNWYAPQKAISAAIERHSLWTSGEGIHASSNTLLPGTDLLQNYTVILIGDFDQPSVSKRVAKKKAKSNETTSDGSRTRGNITVLLQLCGAKVYDVTSTSSSKHIKKGLSKAQLTGIASLNPMGYPEGFPTLKNVVQSYFDSKDEGRVIAMVRDKSDTKLGTDFIAQCVPFVASDPNDNDVIDVISCDWLFDCIGDFQVHKSG
mmetsp:Transcript_4498/g.6877  ORF Transcript_4498/g.6877 Transcript_4498/m.6877 type:complete len:721 (+) Transcript_4498:103-2265(+)